VLSGHAAGRAPFPTPSLAKEGGPAEGRAAEGSASLSGLRALAAALGAIAVVVAASVAPQPSMERTASAGLPLFVRPAWAAEAGAVAVATAPAAAPVAAPAQQDLDLSWARTLSSSAAGVLRSAADLLPVVEKAVEVTAPVVIGGIQTIIFNADENTLPLLGQAVASGAQLAARAGLQVASTGLGVAAGALPVAGQAVNWAIDASMPAFQNAAHSSADALRKFADGASRSGAAGEPDLLRQGLAGVLAGVSAAVDGAGDGAPAAKRALDYLGEAALPVAQALLKSSSEVAGDAARAPLPDTSALTGPLQAAAVDAGRFAAQAGGKALELVRLP